MPERRKGLSESPFRVINSPGKAGGIAPFYRRGKPVRDLKRLSMGPLRLDADLRPGEWRELTAEEIRALRVPEGSIGWRNAPLL